MKKSLNSVVLGGILLMLIILIVGFMIKQPEAAELVINENNEVIKEEVVEVAEDVKYGYVKLDIDNVRFDIYRAAPHNAGGFCGETTIQMGALYYGMYFPQEYVNEVGTPNKIDLHAADVSLAMTNINMNFGKYMDDFGDNELPDGEGLYNGYDVYFEWMREQLDNNLPVFVGVKRSPDIHPNWFVDHFVLLIGYSDTSFQFDSNTEEGQIKFSYDILTRNKHRGYTFKNHNNRRFAYSIIGMEQTKDSIPVRLNLTEFVDFDTVALEGRIENLDDSKEYLLMRFNAISKIEGITEHDQNSLKAKADEIISFSPTDGQYTFEDTAQRLVVSMYYCIEATK